MLNGIMVNKHTHPWGQSKTGGSVSGAFYIIAEADVERQKELHPSTSVVTSDSKGCGREAE